MHEVAVVVVVVVVVVVGQVAVCSGANHIKIFRIQAEFTKVS